MIEGDLKLGSGATDGEIVWVPIPKNATNSFRQILSDWDRIDFLYERCPLPAFAVIRDPISRWFAGVDQYARRHPHLSYGGLLDEVRGGAHPAFDEHTMRQTDYLLSSLTEVELVALENAAEWTAERLGRPLPFTHSRHRDIADDLVPTIRDFYADDFVLYERVR